jgi:hypothetical protein
VTVTECHTVGTKYHEQECTGRWSDGSGSRTVWIDSAGTPRVGQVDQMRIQGGKAYTQSAWLPVELFGGGVAVLLLAGGVFGTLRRRR